jgi:hypothetical protein
MPLYKSRDCNTTQGRMRMKLYGVKRSILQFWHFTDTSVQVLASICIVSWTCIPPSNEGGYDVYWMSYLRQCFGCLAGKKIILCITPLPGKHLFWISLQNQVSIQHTNTTLRTPLYLVERISLDNYWQIMKIIKSPSAV